MKKILASAAALAGTVFFGILFVNNLVSACRYHALLFCGNFAASDKVPSGPWPSLDWSTIDLSMVTTFIPFFGFLLVFWRIWHPAPAGDVPFFAGYDRFNIALGLLGTIWGIILVGFYPAEQVSITSLMKCLHTAMFSTLMAVAWVMVLLPTLIVPLLRFCTDAGANGDAELDQLLERVSSGLNSASGELRKSADDAAKFRAELAETTGALRSMHESAAAGREAEIAWQRSAAETLSALAGAVGKLDAHQRQLLAENARLGTENAELTRKLQSQDDSVRELRRTVEQIRSALES